MTATILIVEDENIVAQDLQAILEDLGYNVPTTAISGEMAIKKTAQIKPNLILMDIRIIGEMDGITTAQTILEQFDIPIVYLTAYSDEYILARAKVTSPFGYIIKPFEERQLRTIIEIALYKHEMERRIKENAQWLATVLKSIGDGVITTNTRGSITFINPVAEDLTGWSFEAAIDRDIQEVFRLVNENTKKTVSSPVAEVLETAKSLNLPQQTVLVRKDGKEIAIADSIAPIVNYKGIIPFKDKRENLVGTVVVFRDISEQRLAAQNLHRQAFYDSLTNLPNREWFMERLTDAVERVKRHPNYLFAVLFLDLDRFKVINDSLGHPVGDQLLVGVASRLLRSIRSIDTVARLGGDEFAILLESIQTLDDACQVAQRIQQELSSSFTLDGQEVFTSTSIGIVLSSTNYVQVEELIRDADIAMYRAKARGKGCYEIFDINLRSQVIAVSQLENELRRAIEKSEIIVYYQPIISLATREVVGFEALVRWLHPQRGLIAPDQFIAIAEETGIIVQLDRWVLREACRQMKEWQEKDVYLSPLSVSVNLSSKHLSQLDCVEQIKKTLDEAGIEPSRLKLEITESAIIESKSAAAVLTQLKALGIALSLDDFGTGYSSLSYLQKFPFDVLKIDRCFIRALDQNPRSATISKTLIQIAHQLSLKVVAEGVETEAELSFLSQNQCDEIQGYFFSPPIAPNELEIGFPSS